MIVLVEPLVGENIGAAARVMANFGLTELRLVRPRDGWPQDRAFASASGADWVLEGVPGSDLDADADAEPDWLAVPDTRKSDRHGVGVQALLGQTSPGKYSAWMITTWLSPPPASFRSGRGADSKHRVQVLVEHVGSR